MKTSITYDCGYVVSAFLEDTDGLMRYKPLRNFGDRQSDAKEFAKDIEEYSETRLNNMAKSYRNDVLYKRINEYDIIRQR